MVRVYGCHPFCGQEVLPVCEEPSLLASGSRTVLALAATRALLLPVQLGPTARALRPFPAAGDCVTAMAYSETGDYVATIENSKRSPPTVRVYVNWRQTSPQHSQRAGTSTAGHRPPNGDDFAGVTPVGQAAAAATPRYRVRMAGHALSRQKHGAQRSPAHESATHVIEISMQEQPLCLACCPTTGNLLVGAAGKRLGLFCRVSHVQRKLPAHGASSETDESGSEHESSEGIDDPNLVDFERFAVLTVAFSPLEVALCENYLAFRSEIDIQVLQVDMGAFAGKGLRQDGSPSARPASTPGMAIGSREVPYRCTQLPEAPFQVEWAGMPTLMHNLGNSLHFSSILYRKFVPSLSPQGAREDLLHSLQLVPIYVHNWHEARTKPPLGGERQMAALSCFFSQSREGFLYDVLDGARLVSRYQYSAVSLQAALGTHLLYVVTRENLECYTVHSVTLATRRSDPEVDGERKACPPPSLEVCSLRMQHFIGLQRVCVSRDHAILFTRAGLRGTRTPRRPQRPKMRPDGGAGDNNTGWNLYALHLTPLIQLYNEMVEYGQQYESTCPESRLHLLCEGHLLLRAAALAGGPGWTEASAAEFAAAFRESCALLGDQYSRLTVDDWRLALPYYRMAGLNAAAVLSRHATSTRAYGRGLLHCLYGMACERELLQQETADRVLQVFSTVEPARVPHLVACPGMALVSPALARQALVPPADDDDAAAAATKRAPTSPLCSLAAAFVSLRVDDDDAAEAEAILSGMRQASADQVVQAALQEPRLVVRVGTEAPGQDGETGATATALGRLLARGHVALMVSTLVSLHESDALSLTDIEDLLVTLGPESEEPCSGVEREAVPSILLDLWEHLTLVCTKPAVKALLPEKLARAYLQRIASGDTQSRPALLSAQELRELSKAHFGKVFPWVALVMKEGGLQMDDQRTQHLEKLQGLLCGGGLASGATDDLLSAAPALGAAEPIVRALALCHAGSYGLVRRLLMESCPSALVPFASHHFPHTSQVSFWSELLVELCAYVKQIPEDHPHLGDLVEALKGAMEGASRRLEPLALLELLPDEGQAAFFLPYLLSCCRTHYQGS
ncbi:unnamed protein product [Lampetra planeri]